MIKSTPKFYHYRIEDSNFFFTNVSQYLPNGGLSIAYKQCEDGTWEYYLCICNPNDQFSKIESRNLLNERIETGKYWLRENSSRIISRNDFLPVVRNYYEKMFGSQFKLS